MPFVKVFDKSSNPQKLLFEYDPERELIRIVRRQVPIIIDLTDYQPGQPENQARARDGQNETDGNAGRRGQ